MDSLMPFHSSHEKPGSDKETFIKVQFRVVRVVPLGSVGKMKVIVGGVSSDTERVRAVALTHVSFIFPDVSTVRVLSSYEVSSSSPVAL